MRLPIVTFQDENRLEIEIGSDSSVSMYDVKAFKNPVEVSCSCRDIQTDEMCEHLKYCKAILDSFFQKKDKVDNG